MLKSQIVCLLYCLAVTWTCAAQQRDPVLEGYMKISRVSTRDKEAAIKEYDRGIALLPNRPECYYRKANVLMSQDEYQKAIDTINILLEKEPEHADALILKGTAYYNLELPIKRLKRQSYSLALASLSRKIQQHPKDYEARAKRAYLYSVLGDRATGSSELERILKEDPGNHYARIQRNVMKAHEITFKP